jgi:hypothetical protein
MPVSAAFMPPLFQPAPGKYAAAIHMEMNAAGQDFYQETVYNKNALVVCIF